MTLSVTARRDVVTARDRQSSDVRLPPVDPQPPAGIRGVLSYFRGPGWPLAVAFVPFALWWALGMTEIVPMAMAVPMALHLFRQRRVDVPRGFGFWLVFLCIVIAGVAMLQVNAVGAAPAASSTRIITWAYRLVWYLTCTIAALYVLNIRKQLPLERVSRIVSWLFLTIVGGGVLGIIAPHFQFHSLVELVVPRSLDSQQFIQGIIHPSAAQLQNVLGHQAPRPSAPYAYTNDWGMNFCVTLPFFVHAWLGKHAGWRRWAAPLILLLATVAAIESVNRGMWLALVIMALFVGVRSALAGRPAIILGLMLAGAAVAVLILSTSLGAVVTARLSNSVSAQGRQNLSTQTVKSVAASSPVVGLGSTRNVQGNFQSIAGGATANCPRCSPPALGTQGQLWLVVFSQGFLGLAMFLVFFGVSFFRNLRRRTPAVTLGLVVLIASAATAPFYDSLGTGLLVTMLAVAVLSREEADDPSARPLRTFADYVVPVARAGAVVLLCAVFGALAGREIATSRPTGATATATVLIPSNPVHGVVSAAPAPMTIDTVAQLVNSDTVLEAVGRASHAPPPATGSLVVTATPNSNVLHISYNAHTAAQAKAGVAAGASTFLSVCQHLLDAERTATLQGLQAQSTTISNSLKPLDVLIGGSSSAGQQPAQHASTLWVRAQRTTLATQLAVINQQIVDLSAAPVPAGAQTQPISVHTDSGPHRVDVVSGALAAFALGALGAIELGRRGRRVRSRRVVFEETNLPVLATLHPNDAANDDVLDRETAQVLETAVAVHGLGSCLPADERGTRRVNLAYRLQEFMASRHGDPRVGVVLASERTRTAAINRARTAAQRRGISIVGVIVIARSASRRPAQASHVPFRNGAKGAADEEKPSVTYSD